MKSTIGRRTLAYASASVFRILVTLATLPLMTKWLDPKDYGLFALAVSVAMVFGILPTVGSSVAMARSFHDASIKARREFLSSMLFLSNIAGFTAAAVYIFFWNALSHHFTEAAADLTLLSLMCIGISIVSSGWATITSEALTLDGRAARFATISIVRDAVGAAVALIALYVYDAGVQALFYGHAAAALADIVSSVAVLRVHLSWRLSLRYIREILFDLQLTVMQFIDVGGRAIERIIIARKLGLDVLGIISHSQSYETIVMALVKSVSRSIWPDNLSEARNPASDFPIARAATEIIATICLFGSIVLSTIGYDIIGILTHGKFNAAAYFAAAWVANVAISTTGFASKAAAYTDGRSGLISMSMVVSRFVSVCALVILIGWVEQPAIIVAAFLAAVSVKMIMYFGIAKFRHVPFQDGKVVISVAISYAAILASVLWGEDSEARIMLFVAWSLVATLVSIGTIRDVGRRMALSR